MSYAPSKFDRTILQLENSIRGVPFFIMAFVLVLCLLFLNYKIFGHRFLSHPIYLSALELDRLSSEEKALIDLLRLDCDAPNLRDFAGLPDVSGAPQASPGTSTLLPNQPATPSSQVQGMLESATVRVIAGGSSGSGFFISNDTVVTNRHVVEGSLGAAIFVTSQKLGGELIKGVLMATTNSSEITTSDFALIRLAKTISNIDPLKISQTPRPLQRVYAAGFPGISVSLDSNSVTPATVFTQGEVNVIQPQQNGSTLILHTANIARGSSGGPLVDHCGQIVGVNTFLRGDSGNVDGRTLYALSADQLKLFLKSTNQKYTDAPNPCSLETSN